LPATLPVVRVLATAALNLALTGAYFASGKLGLALAFVHPSASPVWPPTGLALAALLVFGPRAWPGIFLGAYLVNATTHGSVATSLAIAFGNTLEGVLGAFLTREFAGGRAAFDHPQSVFRFTLLAGLAATTLSATIGVTSLSVAEFAGWRDYTSIWLTWWLGDAGGALVVTPFLVLWSHRPRARWGRRAALEMAALLVALFAAGQLVFGGWLPVGATNYPLSFLPSPILVWAAFRFGPRETATVIVLLSAMAVSGTLQGFGPFVWTTPNESLLLLQAFMGVNAVVALAFAGLVANLRVLRGLLSICAYCKRIRNETGRWETLETYIERRSEAEFTHGLCPECGDKQLLALAHT